MSDVTIEPLDVHDDAALGEWHAVQTASQRHGRAELATVWQLPEVVVMLREESSREVRDVLVARDGGEVVGAGGLTGSTVDNLQTAEVQVDVRPDRRREGVGSALLTALEAAARTRGRSILHAEVAWPYDAEPAGRDSPDVRFALRHGFRLGLVDVQRRLALPVDPALLDRLADEAAPHHAAYTVTAWVGPVPDAIVDSWAALIGTLMTEAPTGEMTREDEAIDAAAVREGEDRAARQGRTKYNAVALDAAGTVVAYTDIATPAHDPGLAFQWGTLVHRDHRGHRLGTAVKVANLRLLAAERPELVTLRTWNAEVNRHMIGVNEQLGFVAAERLGELEKRLS